MFTAKEAAKFARVGLKAFRDWGLPFIENGRRHLFLRSDILQSLCERRKVPYGWNDEATGGKG